MAGLRGQTAGSTAGPGAGAVDAEGDGRIELQAPAGDELAAALALAEAPVLDAGQSQLDAPQLLAAPSLQRLGHGLLLQRVHAREAPDRLLVQLDGLAITGALPALLGDGRTARQQALPEALDLGFGQILVHPARLAPAPRTGKESRPAAFGSRGAVNHPADKYIRLGGFMHSKVAKNYFSILKCGINGVHQHISEGSLYRYVANLDLRYINRAITNTERAEAALKGIRSSSSPVGR